ncbi:hypothetical protein ACUSIJ_14945 [Pseudochelatococcus sp. B33]
MMLALGFGATASYLFFIARMPLPWMTGAMTANAVIAIYRLSIGPPTLIRPAMTGVLGTLPGAYFGAEL